MTVKWSKANNAYVLLMGEALVDIDGKRFFETKKELLEWLEPKGLTVKNDRVVMT